MATVFWVSQGVILTDFLRERCTVNYYYILCIILTCLLKKLNLHFVQKGETVQSGVSFCCTLKSDLILPN
jgi:hypothetical protein